MTGRAFALFHQTIKAQIAAAPNTPYARPKATCQGCLDFAAQLAGRFHLVLVSPEVNRTNPDIVPHSDRALQLLREACLLFSASASPDVTMEITV